MTQKKLQKLQLNLFPLYPELNLVEDRNKDVHEDDNVVASFLFDTATDSTTNLDDLLTTTATATTTSGEGPRSPRSLTYGYSRGRDNSDRGGSKGLVGIAMRTKERDTNEEQWVSYGEVVESKKIKEEEGSSCDGDADADAAGGAWCVTQVQKRSLFLDLKLDYPEVMNACSDKGPLYVDGESPQTVPDLLHDPNMPMDAWNLWSVPEMTSNVGSLKVDDELECKERWKRSEHREASVLRYKEKRQNRLFSKRIRYKVRKLNAEKRPRMKGRFVKRSSDE